MPITATHTAAWACDTGSGCNRIGISISGNTLSCYAKCYVNLVGKVFNRLLLAIFRYYKNKRPPPVSGQPFDAAISIWFTHFYHL